MGIINPIMLLFSFGGLIIIAMYFIKNRYIDFIVPSISLWDKVINEESNITKFEKFKNRRIMYIQLLILLLIVIMLSGLYVNSRKQVSGNALLIIDNSIMMGYESSGKTNLEKAKLEAIKIVENSSENARFSIIVSNGETIFNNGKLDSIKYIEDIYQSNTNINLAKINNQIRGFKSSNEDAYIIGFSNNIGVSGDKNYRYNFAKDNLGITKIDIYKENYNIEINNYTDKEKNVELLIKLDNRTVDSFNVTIKANSFEVVSGKLNESGRVLSAKLNDDDIEIDNYASKTIITDREKKIFLSKSTNTYIRDALILNENLVISESVDGEIISEGFDIYVYQGVEPKIFPTSGAVLLINPPLTSNYVSGNTQKESYVKLSSDDVNSFVEPFYIALSKELSVLDLKTVGTIDDKSIIQKGVIGDVKIFILGFDILDTNFPLKYSFPVYIQNIIQYFLSDSLEDDIYIVSDKIITDDLYTDKEEIQVTKEVTSGQIINIKWILAIIVFIFLIVEMEVFRRDY